MKAERHHKTYVPGMGHDRLLSLYDPLHRLLGMAKVHQPLVDQAGIRPGYRILEIGCGTGNLALLVKRLCPGAEVVGLDPDPKALARAKRKAERKGLALDLGRGFAEELPYADASFDRVLSAFMFHHLGPDEKAETLSEVRRVLKPGGSLHLLDLVEEETLSGGFKIHQSHRNHRNGHPHDAPGLRVPTLMREADLDDPTEVDYRVKKVLGHVAYYRASAPHAGSGADRREGAPDYPSRDR